MQYANGDRYRGGFAGNKRSCENGKYTYANGDEYEGAFRADKKEG